MINLHNYLHTPPQVQQNTRTSQDRPSAAAEPPAGGESSTTETHLSPLARQLTEAQARADARDARLDRDTLARKADEITDQLIGRSYLDNQAKHDAEVPDTDDPALLERAQQATRFANGQGSNPFKGLSPDQLTLIIYDESGTFTVNERRAALQENYDQRERWAREIVDRIMQAHREGRSIHGILKEVLTHYDNLPPIEQAQYPELWVANLKSSIARTNEGHSLSDTDQNNILKFLGWTNNTSQ